MRESSGTGRGANKQVYEGVKGALRRREGQAQERPGSGNGLQRANRCSGLRRENGVKFDDG